MNFIALDAYSDLLDSAGHFLSPKSILCTIQPLNTEVSG
jgi:hypothetical protein